MIVIHVAAVEKRHLLGKLRLCCGEARVAAAKSAKGIFRQGAVVVNLEGAIEKLTHGLKNGGGVDDRGEGRRERAHQVGMAKDGIADTRLLLAIVGAGALDNIANFHIRWAGDLAAFAVDAVF